MIIKNFFYSVVFLFELSVSVSVQEKLNEQSLLRGRYGVNHPPNVEYYNPLLEIKVNEGEDQFTKKEGFIVARSIKDITESKDEPTNYKLGGTNDSRDASEQNVDKINTKVKESSLRSQEIPTTAVYASETFQETNKAETTSLKPTRKIKSQRRRQQKLRDMENYHVYQKPSTSENITDNPELVSSTQKYENFKVTTEHIEKQAATKSPKKTRQRKPVVPIIENENFVFGHKGDFHYSYEGGDGTKAFERGQLRTFNDETAGEAVEGSFSYTDRDGNDFSLSYTADENGYRPTGAHLPTPPPIPLNQ